MKKIIVFLFNKFYYHSFVRFLFVGALGIVTDAIVLYSLRHVMGLIPAKIVSYIAAYSVTWLLNRDFTFHSTNDNRFAEWFKYSLTYGLTGVLHVVLFAFLVYRFLFLHEHPIWALLITSTVMAFINFGISKRYIFKPKWIHD